MVPQPAYADYGNAARAAGLSVEDLALDPETGFALSFEALESARPGGRPWSFSASRQPQRPDRGPRRLRALATAHPDSLFVIDEAFAEFVPDLDRLAGAAPTTCSCTSR